MVLVSTFTTEDEQTRRSLCACFRNRHPRWTLLSLERIIEYGSGIFNLEVGESLAKRTISRGIWEAEKVRYL